MCASANDSHEPDQPTSSLPVVSISIVVPNYNNGSTLARTLQSLVDQNYPALEIVVADGGSTDDSVEVIKRFEPHIAWWTSERDSGQSNAINKGLAQCTGEIVNWLCSDDVLVSGALQLVSQTFAQHPDTDIVVGRCRMIDQDTGKELLLWTPNDEDIGLIPCCNPIAQPSCFFRRSLLDRNPPLDESYRYALDCELWAYFASRGARWRCIDEHLSIFYETGVNKTATGGKAIAKEMERLYRAYTNEWIPLVFWHRYFRNPLIVIQARHSNRALRRLVYWVEATINWLLTPFYGYKRVRAMRWEHWYNQD